MAEFGVASSLLTLHRETQHLRKVQRKRMSSLNKYELKSLLVRESPGPEIGTLIDWKLHDTPRTYKCSISDDSITIFQYFNEEEKIFCQHLFRSFGNHLGVRRISRPFNEYLDLNYAIQIEANYTQRGNPTSTLVLQILMSFDNLINFDIVRDLVDKSLALPRNWPQLSDKSDSDSSDGQVVK